MQKLVNFESDKAKSGSNRKRPVVHIVMPTKKGYFDMPDHGTDAVSVGNPSKSNVDEPPKWSKNSDCSVSHGETAQNEKSTNVVEHYGVCYPKKSKPEEFYKCRISGCKKIYRYLHNFTKHSLSHLGSPVSGGKNTVGLPYRCSHVGCDQACKSLKDLVNHKRIHSLYTCTVGECGAIFDSRKLFNEHRLVHGQRTTHTITLQPKSSLVTVVKSPCASTPAENSGIKVDDSSDGDTKNGIQLGADSQTFTCLVADCSRTFSKSEDLEGHSLSHCDKRPLPYKCEVTDTGSTFKYSIVFENHRLTPSEACKPECKEEVE